MELNQQNLVEYLANLYKYLKNRAETLDLTPKDRFLVSPKIYEEVEKIAQERNINMDHAYFIWLGLMERK